MFMYLSFGLTSVTCMHSCTSLCHVHIFCNLTRFEAEGEIGRDERKEAHFIWPFCVFVCACDLQKIILIISIMYPRDQ